MIIEILKTAVEHPQGFTIDLSTLEHVNSGIVVAYQATQDSFGDEGLKHVIQHASAHDNVIGGWYYEGKYYFDSNRVFTDMEEAKAFGKSQKQIAIFDLDNMKLVKL